MSYFHETIWMGVPKFLRRVDTALKNIGINERVPYNAPLIQFSSWMGGDRDGMILFSSTNNISQYMKETNMCRDFEAKRYKCGHIKCQPLDGSYLVVCNICHYTITLLQISCV